MPQQSTKRCLFHRQLIVLRELSSVTTTTMPESESQTSQNQPASAESLEQQVRASFEQLGYAQLQALGCSVESGMLRLTGELESFYLKQVAQSVAIKIMGPHNVHNLIEVV